MDEDIEDEPSFGFAENAEYLDEACRLLAATANFKRLRMLSFLMLEEMSVSQIAKLVDLEQSATSQHLAKLRAVGLVETRREAQQIFYACRSDKATRLLHVLRSLGEQI